MLEYEGESFTIYSLVNSDKEPKNCRFIVDPYPVDLTTIPERWTDFIYNAVVECHMIKLLAVTEYYLDKTTAILIAKLLKSHPTISEIFFDKISAHSNLEGLYIILDAIPLSKIQKFTFQLDCQNLDVLKKLSNALIASKVKHVSIICGYTYVNFDKKLITEWLTPILQKSKSVTSLSIDCKVIDWTAFKEAMAYNNTIEELRICEEAADLDPQHTFYQIIQKSKTIRNIVIRDNIFVDDDTPYTILCNTLMENKTLTQIEFNLPKSSSNSENSQKLQNIFRIIKQRNIVVQITANGLTLENDTSLKMFLDLIEQNLVNGLHLNVFSMRSPNTPSLYASLMKNTSMERITFSEVTWETDTPWYVRDYVGSAKNLKSLTLYGDHIYSEANFLRILDGIGDNANLRTVHIGMEIAFSSKLFDFMANNKTIKTLEVPNIVINEEDIEAYCNFLEQNDTLTSMSFSNMDIGVEKPQQIDQIRKSLEKNWSLMQCYAGLRGLENNVVKRNRKQYCDAKSGTIILAHNIMQSEYAKSLLPVEIWSLIFSHLSYPGIGSCQQFSEQII